MGLCLSGVGCMRTLIEDIANAVMVVVLLVLFALWHGYVTEDNTSIINVWIGAQNANTDNIQQGN